MKQTLLEIVQNILASMDSEEVNSISETDEAQQVAEFVRETYNYLASSIDFPEHYSFFELVASGDINKPVLMTLPSNCLELIWIKYNNKETGDTEGDNYVDVQFMHMDDFLKMMNGLNVGDTNVAEMTYTANGESFTSKYYNDRFPRYYTTFDDFTLLFDAFKSTEDTTLQKSKTQVYGKLSSTFTVSDSFTPDLDAQVFTMLLNETKKQCFTHLKQQADPISSERARRSWIRSQKNRWGLPGKDLFETSRHYGRK